MANAFALAAAALAADPNIGAPAVYTPEDEAPMSIRVVLSRDEGPALGVGQGIVAGGYTVMIKTADVPDRPVRGELISVTLPSGLAYDGLVETAEIDPTGATWLVSLRRNA